MDNQKIRSDEELIEQYASEALQLMSDRSLVAANRRIQSILEIGRELKRRGPEAQAQLLPLLEHEDPEVRYWAATESLAFAPIQAELVLRVLAAHPSVLIGLHAKQALDDWERETFALALKFKHGNDNHD